MRSGAGILLPVILHETARQPSPGLDGHALRPCPFPDRRPLRLQRPSAAGPTLTGRLGGSSGSRRVPDRFRGCGRLGPSTRPRFDDGSVVSGREAGTCPSWLNHPTCSAQTSTCRSNSLVLTVTVGRRRRRLVVLQIADCDGLTQSALRVVARCGREHTSGGRADWRRGDSALSWNATLFPARRRTSSRYSAVARGPPGRRRPCRRGRSSRSAPWPGTAGGSPRPGRRRPPATISVVIGL